MRWEDTQRSQIAALRGEAEEPLSCTKCKGKMFLPLKFSQYKADTASVWGLLPPKIGAEYTLLECVICEHRFEPYRTGVMTRRPQGDYDLFNKTRDAWIASQEPEEQPEDEADKLE